MSKIKDYIQTATEEFEDWKPTEADIELYMNGLCGPFALALANLRPGGMVDIISDDNGDHFSDKYPFEFTHAVYNLHGIYYDVQGAFTSENAILKATKKFLDEDRQTQLYWAASFTPQKFRKLIGNGMQPLAGTAQDVKEAIQFIKDHRKFYGIY